MLQSGKVIHVVQNRRVKKFYRKLRAGGSMLKLTDHDSRAKPQTHQVHSTASSALLTKTVLINHLRYRHARRRQKVHTNPTKKQRLEG